MFIANNISTSVQQPILNFTIIAGSPAITVKLTIGCCTEVEIDLPNDPLNECGPVVAPSKEIKMCHKGSSFI